MARIHGTDIELGLGRNAPLPIATHAHSLNRRGISRVPSIFSACKAIFPRIEWKETDRQQPLKQIEDYANGYPRFSALIASNDSFHIGRQFSYLRARLLLLKQDRLTILERKLEAIDQNETIQLRLGSARFDSNADRVAVLSDIEEALDDYDSLIERNQRIFSLEPARPRFTSSLKNWIDGNGSIAREESAYLSHTNDLVSVAPADETTMTWLDAFAEDAIIYLRKQSGKKLHHSISRDPNVHIPTKSFATLLGRTFMTPFIIVLLMVPVIVCNYVSSLTTRLCAIILATTTLVAILSSSTRAKTIELVVAGATYATVLVVFISSTP